MIRKKHPCTCEVCDRENVLAWDVGAGGAHGAFWMCGRCLTGATREHAVAAGQRVARFVFAKRGNHSEAHLGETELVAIAAAAFELGAEWATMESKTSTASARAALPADLRLGHDDSLACAHRDVTCCTECAAAHVEVVEVVSRHYWVPDETERAELKTLARTAWPEPDGWIDTNTSTTARKRGTHR